MVFLSVEKFFQNFDVKDIFPRSSSTSSPPKQFCHQHQKYYCWWRKESNKDCNAVRLRSGESVRIWVMLKLCQFSDISERFFETKIFDRNSRKEILRRISWPLKSHVLIDFICYEPSTNLEQMQNLAMIIIFRSH